MKINKKKVKIACLLSAAGVTTIVCEAVTSVGFVKKFFGGGHLGGSVA